MPSRARSHDADPFMKTSLRLLFLPLLFALAAPFALGAPSFAWQTSDLQPDPALHFGVLPNGVRYVVMANHEPKGRASLRLVVLAGSFYEKPDQQGLAHFLEHMAFKGSTHYPPGTLIEDLQRMGMSFGADTNAYTSFDHTAFMLELPDTKPATLADGCRIFADYGGGLLLRQDQIDPERGVILSEKRDRDSIAYRTTVAEMKFILPDSLIPDRFPIGHADVIEHAMRDRFADLYNTWYRPERLTVIAVGDFDPAAVEALIKRNFDPLKDHAPARAEPDLGTIPSFDGLRVDFHPEAEAPATTVTIETVTPYHHENDTAATRLKYLPRDLAVAMLNRRLAILSRKENAPFTSASTGVSENFDFFRNASIDVTGKPGNWRELLGVGEQELRRALDHGFQPGELQEAVANYRNALEQAVQGAATRRSSGLASSLIQSMVQKQVFTSPAEDLALYGPALDQVTVDDCLRALRRAWSATGRYVFVSGNLTLTDPDAAILAAYHASEAVAVQPPPKLAEEKFPYTDFGAPGQVASEKHIADLGVTEITFANGVRLDLKPTDFQANQINISVRVGAGKLTEPATTEPGLAMLANATFTAGGLGQLSIDELQRVLAGKTVGVGFSVGDDAFNFSGATNRADLPLELQLITAYLTDPGYRPESLWTAHKSFAQQYLRLAHTPEGVLSTQVARLLANGDPRFGLPAESDLMARTLGEVKAWLAPQFAHGPMEIAVVGDFDPAAVVAAVAQTLGALPAREPKPAYTAERQVAFPAAPFAKDYTVQTEIPKGLIYLTWPTTGSRDVHLARRLALLGSVFSDRLRIKIRMQMSGAYSPYAYSDMSDVYPNYGAFTAVVTVDPAKADAIAQAVLAIAGDLQRHGVTADELERAKNPALTAIAESVRTNSYWLGSVLKDAQEEPERLDWARSRSADFASITAADLDALAAKYLDPARAFKIIVLPAAK